ncbi:methyltransferase [Flavobacterium sp. CS20]|jgi:thiopurine S-methyltransferase|uniref:methyltransferase n=1 Tax=Flavobacterium sp. CS20 TaxID=2775246 RepID=UPI001B3A7AC4|nr:methyltransferase [Flavobacterium sp. CS20]QTY27125.1 methyltransferase [Flavobacterium sp. CS20]
MIDIQNYWEERYKKGKTGWDMNQVSPPLKNYIDQLKDKSLKILIPGAGNAYEAEYLFQNNFKNVTVADIAKIPLNNFKNRLPNFPQDNLLHIDFFDINDTFDLIIEQTFFCALPPKKRPDYVKKMHDLLKPNGKLVGLLFNFPLTDEGPPFGGNINQYQNYFEELFCVEKLEPCKNSHPKRQEKELFFIGIKK